MIKATNKSGIVMLDLMVTIVVIVALASIVIYQGFGSMDRMHEAKFKTELSNCYAEFEEFVENKITNIDLEEFERESLVANENSLNYNTKKSQGGNIKTIIPDMPSIFEGKLEVQSGELVMKNLNEDQARWAQELEIRVIN